MPVPSPNSDSTPTPMTVGIAIRPAPTKISMNAVVTRFDGSFGFCAFARSFMKPMIPKTKPARKAIMPASCASEFNWPLSWAVIEVRSVTCARAVMAVIPATTVATAAAKILAAFGLTFICMPFPGCVRCYRRFRLSPRDQFGRGSGGCGAAHRRNLNAGGAGRRGISPKDSPSGRFRCG